MAETLSKGEKLIFLVNFYELEYEDWLIESAG